MKIFTFSSICTILTITSVMSDSTPLAYPLILLFINTKSFTQPCTVGTGRTHVFEPSLFSSLTLTTTPIARKVSQMPKGSPKDTILRPTMLRLSSSCSSTSS